MKTLKYTASLLGLLIVIISCAGGTPEETRANDSDINILKFTPGKNISGKVFDRVSKDTNLQTSSHIRHLLIDKENRIWFGTYLLGFGVYDGDGQYRFETPNGTNGNIIRKMITDKNGDVWMASNYGLIHYNHLLPADMPDSYNRFTTKDGLPSNQIWSICADPNGGFWAGTENGLCHYDGKNFTSLQLPGAPAELPANAYATSFAINSITLAGDEKLWIGTNGNGLFIYTPSTPEKGFLQLNTSDGLCDNIVNCITIDKKGIAWIATRSGGISRYDGSKFTTINTKNGLPGNFVWTVMEDRFGQIWAGTAGNGAVCMNGNNINVFNVKNGMADNYVQSIIEDDKGNIWFGTGMGITRYNDNHLFEKEAKTAPENREAIRKHMESFPASMDGC